ncbi:hypothetical protein LUZ60_013698 [Juncus effusus]|nr:hypothetical protein LUZ60_013698 [Juncus effusus]
MSKKSLAICPLFFSLIIFFAISTSMATQDEKTSPYIIYLERPADGADPEAYQFNVLRSFFGSDEAAKKALIYHYTSIASGFAARLTEKQAEEIQKLPKVTRVQISKPYKLFGSAGSGI